MVSVSFPLKGRDMPAVRVNRAMISPFWVAPPSELSYAGNSGIIMLKLPANNACDRHNSKKGRE